MSVRDLIDGLLRREGSVYTNHSADRGGPTRYGITLAKLSEWRRRPCTPADVEQLTEDEARGILANEYYIGPGFSRIIDVHLQELVVDAGVNHGVGTAARWIQAAAGVDVDGQLGPRSIASINARDAMPLYLSVLAQRVRLFGRLVSNDPKLKALGEPGRELQAIFSAGWNNRAAEFIELAARRVEERREQ